MQDCGGKLVRFQNVRGVFAIQSLKTNMDLVGVDDKVFQDVQAPLVFVRKSDGTRRGMGHIRLEWDENLHDTVGSTTCTNGAVSDGSGGRILCPAVGRIRHLGSKFDASNDPVGGLPITPNPEIVGLTGGFGWLLTFDEGSPQNLRISQVDLTEDTALYLAIPYPTGVSFSVAAKAAPWCSSSMSRSCEEVFTSVSSQEDVRASIGNVYHFDQETGLLFLRISMFPDGATGFPDWKLFTFDEVRSFSRSGVLVPEFEWNNYFEITADCSQSGAYCSEKPTLSSAIDDVCPQGLQQVSYDKCCASDGSNCVGLIP